MAPVVEETVEAAETVAEKAEVLTVCAPLVQVSLGGRPVQFYRGDVLPDGVAVESIAHLKSLGYVKSDN